MERRPHLGARKLLVALAVGLVAIVAVGCSARAKPPASASTPAEASSNVAPSGVAAAPAAPVAVTPVVAVPTVAPTPTTIPVPSAVELGQSQLDGKTLAPGGWAAGGVVLSFQASLLPGQNLLPEVEVVPSDQPFSGAPTAKGTLDPATGSAAEARITLKDLAPGEYRWQARFSDAQSAVAGPWVTFSEGKAGFGLAGSPPAVQDLTLNGAAHQAANVPIVGAKDQPTLTWKVSDPFPTALDRVVYAADHQKNAAPTPPASAKALDPTTTSAPLGDLADGDWELHVWAVDRAGQTSSPATLAVQVQRTPPALDDVLYRTWATNPLYQTIPISFTLSSAAKVTMEILPASANTPIRTFDLGTRKAGATVQTSWDGKNASGNVVPVGSYRFMVDATDDAGNQTQALYSGLTITNKVIKVFLASESMTAYEGGQVFLSTVITSGGQALPTRPGQFEIQEKAAPFVFHAQYPRGSPYWFPDVTSHHAMLFDPPDANFIHDAPWRSVYGPGTNGRGIPGSTYTGSHGCVETPEGAMDRLWDWTPMGTPVIVIG